MASSFSDTDACDALATASTPTTDVTAGDDLSVTWQGGVGADVTIYLVPTADVEVKAGKEGGLCHSL